MDSGPFASDDEALAVVAGFEATTLSKGAFNHRAHLLVGLWYLDHHPLEEVRRSFPEAIKRFNAVAGTTPGPRGGYHETITQFYLTMIARFRADWRGSPSLAVRANALFDAVGGPDLLARYYPDEVLWTPEARATWLQCHGTD